MATDSRDQHQTRGASRSLEKLLSGPGDITGLIAYGLFKVEQTEWAKASPRTSKEVQDFFDTLQDARAESLRARADELLVEWFGSASEQIREEQAEELRAEIEAEIDQKLLYDLKESFEKTISKNTIFRFWPNFLVNVAAWIASLALSALIIYGFVGPSWSDVGKKLFGS